MAQQTPRPDVSQATAPAAVGAKEGQNWQDLLQVLGQERQAQGQGH